MTLLGQNEGVTREWWFVVAVFACFVASLVGVERRLHPRHATLEDMLAEEYVLLPPDWGRTDVFSVGVWEELMRREKRPVAPTAEEVAERERMSRRQAAAQAVIRKDLEQRKKRLDARIAAAGREVMVKGLFGER